MAITIFGIWANFLLFGKSWSTRGKFFLLYAKFLFKNLAYFQRYWEIFEQIIRLLWRQSTYSQLLQEPRSGKIIWRLSLHYRAAVDTWPFLFSRTCHFANCSVSAEKELDRRKMSFWLFAHFQARAKNLFQCETPDGKSRNKKGATVLLITTLVMTTLVIKQN